MEDDSVDRPPAGWHTALQRLLDAERTPARRLVIDLSRMSLLIGADVGFLIKIAERVRSHGGSLVVVAQKKEIRRFEILRIGEVFEACKTLDEALGTTS